MHQFPENTVLQTGDFKHEEIQITILSNFIYFFSWFGYQFESGKIVYLFNGDGPVYAPNGEYELDPENTSCRYGRQLFSSCKNNCPGGELSVMSFTL